MAKKKWQQLFWRWQGVLAIAPSVAVAVILLRSIGLLQSWEWAAFDQYMRLRPEEAADSRVVIVGVDEKDLNNLNRALIPDGTLANAISLIKAQSPRAIGLDLYRDIRVAPGERALTEVFKTTPNLVGIRKVVGKARQDVVPGPATLTALGQIGANDLISDADNTVRRGPIWLQDSRGNPVYSLGFYLSLLYLEADDISIHEVEPDVWWLGQALFRPFEASDGGYVSADAGGYQQIINYRSAESPFEIISITDVLAGRLPEGWATDKVVLIGTVSESANDFFYTPYSSTLLSLPETKPGVEIHAHFTSQIISAAVEGRSLIKSWPEIVEWAWILLWAVAGTLLAWQFNHSHRTKQQVWQEGCLLAGAPLVLTASTYLPFLSGWWIPVVPAFLSAAGAATVTMIHIARSASDIRRTFGRYLSDDIVTMLLENPEGQKLGGDRRKVTILTSDLRGFTAISERLSPECVIKVLNFYLGHMADIINRYSGTIDEYMGDGILVLFGAPIVRDNDAQRAVACAIEMQLAMAHINAQMKAWNIAPLEMGIGIHTGEVVVGNIGSERRAKYGVVGAPVNLTYRIESFTTGGQVLISEETGEAVGSSLQVRHKKVVKSKGIAQPTTVFEIGGIGYPYHLSLPSQCDLFVRLALPIKVVFSVLEGKHITEETKDGYLIKLSEKGALLRLKAKDKNALSSLDNLKINLVLDAAIKKEGSQDIYSEDTYAKVIEETRDMGVFHIQFTAMPPKVKHRLDKIYQIALEKRNR